MPVWMLLNLSFRSLAASKLRCFLAVLGIVIGTGSVIAMLALGAGAQKRVVSQITSLGTNLVVVRPGRRGSAGVSSGSQQNLTVADMRAVQGKTPGIRQMAPVVMGGAQAKYLNKNIRANVIGSAAAYLSIRSFEIARGRCFSDAEIENSARVAIVGPAAAEKLFGEENPVGKIVKLNSINFHIAGVLKAKGDQGWFNPDEMVLVPYTTAMKQLFGLDHLSEIDVQAASGADLELLQSVAKSVLRQRHRLQADTTDDFEIRSQAEMIEMFSNVHQIFSLLLGGIAGISLLVGGIGIMNIMLVTVTERTREIGIRKAIGARNRDILRQFLFEAVTMTGLGGVLGVALGFGISAAINHIFSFPATVEASSVVIAAAFSVAVGLFFGYYPARRAAALRPIDALRYE